MRLALAASDRLLLGVDLRKSRAMLEAAYDDAQGVTARFTRNLLVRIDRELGGRFGADSFAHRARWCEDEGKIEIHLVSRRAQRIAIAALGLEIAFARDEAIHIEDSFKYSPAEIDELLKAASLRRDARWLDAAVALQPDPLRPRLNAASRAPDRGPQKQEDPRKLSPPRATLGRGYFVFYRGSGRSTGKGVRRPKIIFCSAPRGDESERAQARRKRSAQRAAGERSLEMRLHPDHELAFLVALGADHDEVAVAHAHVGPEGSLHRDREQDALRADVERAHAELAAVGKLQRADLVEREVEAFRPGAPSGSHSGTGA